MYSVYAQTYDKHLPYMYIHVHVAALWLPFSGVCRVIVNKTGYASLSCIVETVLYRLGKTLTTSWRSLSVSSARSLS